MTYYDDYLEHHGVKGMKWGVRRYKEARKEGKRADRDRDISTNRMFRSAKKVSKYDKKASDASKSGDKVNAKRYKDLSKAEQNKVNVHYDKMQEANRRYKAAVAKAANTKVTIKRNDTLAEGKRVGKRVGAGLAVANSVAALTLNPAAGIVAGAGAGAVTRTRRTRNDRFAEAVDETQNPRKQKKSGTVRVRVR